MTTSDDENERLAHFLETEVLSESEVSDQEELDEDKAEPKRPRLQEEEDEIVEDKSETEVDGGDTHVVSSRKRSTVSMRVESGGFGKIPPELFRHILKFLSSEDLVSCSLVCRCLNYAASDESLWRRLYCMRWGFLPLKATNRQCDWKKLYIQRDEEDIMKLVRNCPPEFKSYYIQMQAAKRSQAPLPSQVKDDRIILDETVADQVTMWKTSRGFTDKVDPDHACSGETCSYHCIGDVFICEKTGNVHVCDDTCREVDMDPANDVLVCQVSGHCFDRLLSHEMEPEPDAQQGGVIDESDPSGRFGRAYLLGYNCVDEKELKAALRFCWFC